MPGLVGGGEELSRLDGWETIAFFFYIVAFPETSRAGSAARWAASREGRGGCSGICRKINTATLVCFGPAGNSPRSPQSKTTGAPRGARPKCSIRVDFPPPRRNLLAREHLPPGTPSPRSEERGLCRSHTPQVLRHPTGPQIRILALDDFPKTTFGLPWQDIPPRFAVTF